MPSVQEIELLRKRALGWTIACPPVMPGLDLGRDLLVAAGPNGIDFARVEGIEALTQSLSLALTTLFGSDVFNASFGFDGLNALADESNPVMVRERVRVGVIKVLRRENRVRRIVDVNLSGDGRLEPPPPGSRVLDVRVVFEAISGEQVDVSLGKAAGNG